MPGQPANPITDASERPKGETGNEGTKQADMPKPEKSDVPIDYGTPGAGEPEVPWSDLKSGK
jgi:hypothetical protein